MKNPRIILASASARRRQLLEQAGFKIEVASGDFDETKLMKAGMTPKCLVETIALRKAENSLRDYENCVIIAADTIVCLGGRVYGKPADTSDAAGMLKALSGNTHTVYTGVCIVYRTSDGERIAIFSDTTTVTMKELDESEISAYISTGEPLDRAGSYTLAETGSMFVTSIEGNFSTVLGLPMHKLYDELKKIGLDPFMLRSQT